MAEIITVENSAEAASALSAVASKLIRIEGFCGVGKTTIAQIFSEVVGAAHVEGDKFAIKQQTPLPYRDCIRQEEFDAAVRNALSAGRHLILDAICLDDIAPVEKWGCGLLVYVKRISFNNPTNPIWHGGLDLERDVPERELRRSVHLYHLTAKPHERADIILELPEFGHALPKHPFERSLCFDPPTRNDRA